MAILRSARWQRARRGFVPSCGWASERADRTMLAAGTSNEVVARALGVSVNTVKTHVRTVYGKLGVQSRTGLVARVRAEGLLA